MGIIRIIRLAGFALSLGAFLMLGQQYFTAMTVPENETTRFVSADGSTPRDATKAPSFVATLKDYAVEMFTGKEKPKPTGLAALNARNRAPAMSYDERTMREIDFWTNFTGKMGFGGF